MAINPTTDTKAPAGHAATHKKGAQDELLLDTAWPVGSVFISVVATDPSTLLGFGTWAAIAAGKMLIGLDSGDATMNTPEETGGAKTHTITANELPTHTHTQRIINSGTAGASGPQGASAAANANAGQTGNNTTTASAVNIMNPFFVVYMWKRTA